VEQYDPGLNSWSSKRPIPTPRWKLASGAVNGIIYAIGGGSTGNQCGATGTVEAYDPLTDSWSAKGSMPTPRWGAASAAINNLIYVVGGSLACPQIIVNPSTALEVYDPATDIWAAQMQMPTARWDLAAAAANGKIYAIGGWDPLSQTVLATVEEFDPTTNSWTTKSPMPMARSGLVAVTLNGKIYAFGGSDNVNVLAVLEVYDPLADTWTKISPGSPPPVTHTLTVASTNPSSGVGVVVSPSDNNSQGNGTTQFTRTYNDGNVVTLTAVTTVNGNNFSSWSGCDSTSTSTCTVTMNADRTVTANYISPPPPPLPDLTITSVRPVQVVYEVDLVLGKNTAFEVTVHVDSKDLLPSASIPIVLNLENDAWSAACSRIDSAQVCTESITKDKFRPAAPGGFDAVVYFNPNPRISPVRTGSHQIVAVVNPGCGILESNCNNNVNASTVEVKATNALNLIYIAVPACNALLPGACYGPLSEPLQTTIDNTNVFIQATYPLSESGLSWTESPTPFLGSSIFGKTGIIEDVVKIGIWNSLTDPSSNRKAVAIVPKHDQTQSYFEYHGYPDALGMTVNKGCCRTALVTEGAWTAGAHELGHLHGLQLDEEEYIVQNGVVTYPGNLANGFWVNANKPIFFSTCFMGASELHPDLVSPLVSRWVDKNHYVQLFQKRTSSSDPEVLLVTAVLHADGTLDLRSWYDIPNGQITKSMPGEYTVRMLDGTRQTLAEISVPVSFTVEVEPFGVQPIDVVPLVITIPYPTTAATVEILRGGQVLTRVSPISKTLADAIEAIPDFGLVKNADQRRTALRNEVEAIAQMLSVGANKSAYQAVFHDLRPAVQSWLLDNYVKTAPDQLEKNEVLFVIDGALERILNLGN